MLSKSNHQSFDKYEKLVTIIYSRNIFSDFRIPVELLYPSLTNTYLSIVKKPMDLGTLLVKVLKKELKDINEFKYNLQLIHKNALLFNEGW